MILSTVRVKPGNRFVSLLNRFIVAASRARLGFYIVGSKSAVSEVNPTTGALKGPPHWLTFLNHLSNKSIDHNDLDGFDRKRIDQTIPICCPQHRQKSHRDVPSLLKDRKFPCASNWNTFCSELCDFHLRCGHNCNQPCHMFDPWNHQKRCQKPIKNPCELHSNALLSCVEIVELQTNDMSCVEDVFLVPDLWKCNRRVVVKLAHCGHAMYLFCHQYKKCKAKEQKWPQCQEVVDNFTLPCGHIIEGPKCWEYDQYLSGKLPQCSQPVMIQKRGCSHEHEVACHQVEEETRKPCTKKINHPRPRCKHDMSFLCCDAQELDKMWRSKYRVCHLNEQGQSELLESEPYGPPESILMPSKNITKCHKKITIKRTCGHECKLICDEGFDLVNQKKLPKCKQKVTISCPLCKHETFQVDCCFKDLYQVVALESFNMLQDSEGNLNEFVNILKLDVLAYEGADVIFNKLLSSNCPQHLSFYKPSCDHMMTFACHDLLRLIMNNMQLPLCEESIDRILPCGHSVEIMCYQRHDHPPVCKEQSPPFQFPTCEHSLQVKTCTEFMKTKQRFDEGKLFCKALSEVQLPRCGHNVDIVCGKRQQGVQLQRKGAKLIDNTVIESIVYCIPCEEAPRCEERVTFERQCGHFDNSIFCQDAFSWTQEAVPKKIPPLCRQYIQSVLHPLCGHATDVPCWMKNAFATWNPWGEGQAGDWLNSADLPLQIESTPTVASSALVKHFIHPAKGSATSNSLVKYSFTDASSDVLSCSEVIQVVFADCGHSTACKCGMFFMANFGSQLGAATPSLQCGESVSRLCSEGHARSMPCHESKALSDISNIDKVCTAKMDKCCLYCGVNMVVSKCCDRDVFCNQEVTTTLSCGHVVSWKCSDNIDSNHDPRESFDPKHQLYLKCKGCMVELWEKEKTLTISLEDLRQHCLRQAKSVIGEDISDPVEIEIASIFESTYERARLDIICNFQRFIYKNSVEAVEKFEFPKDWDLDEVHRPDRYVANNYELVFLNCDLDKQPDVKLIHQRRFETKDTIFGTSLKVQRLTKDALFALAREGEVKIAVALAFRLHEKTMKEGFVTPNQVDTEMKKHANKLMIKTLQEGFDYATEDKEDQNSYLYFWKAKAVVPLYILHLTLHTTCNICLENHPNHRKYGAICSSNHFVCWDCLGDYIEAAEAADAIGGYVDATGGLVCPEPNCKKHQQIYDQNLLRSSAPQAIFERLWNLKIKIEANKAEQKVAAAAEEKLKIELDRIKSMGDTQRQVHFLRQKIIDDILTSRCPRCKQAYYYSDFDNCFALSCVNKSCKAEFCAWCEEDCGEDAHRHVANCQYNTNRGHVHGSKQDLKKVKIKIQTAKIEQLLNQEKPQITKEVLNSSKMELEDFKEYLAACGIK